MTFLPLAQRKFEDIKGVYQKT